MSIMEIFGYSFKNAALLEEALTTPSFKMSSPDAADNQRLEFLGDAVLGFIAAERLYGSLPDAPEGVLTVKRTHMGSSAALCAAAARHDLAPRLRRNKGAAPLPENSKTLADAVEAVIGAAFLDGGLGKPHSRVRRAIFGNALKLLVGVYSGGLQYHVCKRVLAHVLYFTKKHRGLCCVLTVSQSYDRCFFG